MKQPPIRLGPYQLPVQVSPRFRTVVRLRRFLRRLGDRRKAPVGVPPPKSLL